MPDRRQVLSGAAALAIAGFVGSPRALANAREQTRIISRSAVLERAAKPPLDFDLFYDLSRYVTARANLDREVAQLHFEPFSKEEWGWANAASLYSLIQYEISAGAGSAPEVLAAGLMTDTDLWYAQHLLDAWYEGFYRYEGQEMRVTYEHALMWQAVSDLVPVQGMSDREYGYWTSAPEPGDSQ